MKLTIDMPWERDLSVNHCRMGPQGNWHLKPHVEEWMDRLAWEVKAGVLQGYDDWTVSNRYELISSGLVSRYRLPLYLFVDMRFPDRRKRDSHNFHYVIANAVAAGLGIDDRHIRISTGSVTADRERPGFTITVEDRQDD